MSRLSYKDESKKDWGEIITHTDQKLGDERLKLGAIMRIADAVEKMATPFAEVWSDRARYEKWYRDEREKNNRMAKRISALQGVITRMKKKQKP